MDGRLSLLKQKISLDKRTINDPTSISKHTIAFCPTTNGIRKRVRRAKLYWNWLAPVEGLGNHVLIVVQSWPRCVAVLIICYAKYQTYLSDPRQMTS